MRHGRSLWLSLRPLGVLAVCLGAWQFAWAQMQIAYVKEHRQYIGAEVSATARMVPGEGDARITPRWAVDGRSVLFARSREQAGRIVEVDVVVAATAAAPRTLVVNFADQGGVRLAGARAVKSIGWLGSERFFIVGDVNPRQDEMRIFDATTGAETNGYTGAAFAACAEGGRVAYLQAQGMGSAVDILVGDERLATVDGGDAVGPVRFLLWGTRCERLYALRVGERSAELVAVERDAIKPLHRLPAVAYMRAMMFDSVLVLEDFEGNATFVDLARPAVPVAAEAPARQRLRLLRQVGSSVGSAAFDIKWR
ncbi:hypothetical protein RA210_U410003 [Rubrivivax sp. A210]|uniref:hypothetical protein n=1 Tax=Rubrivivax sp. A210 TaxID=2772301 RepID=UPI00191920A5|nr:hypothetical protein [Rubrivivax sp. A210]CAD5373998.1 hypothetical protein RA210_U410003 [Rubrivivax sp. A210]